MATNLGEGKTKIQNQQYSAEKLIFCHIIPDFRNFKFSKWIAVKKCTLPYLMSVLNLEEKKKKKKKERKKERERISCFLWRTTVNFNFLHPSFCQLNNFQKK